MWLFPGNHYSVHILDTENRTSVDKGSEPFAWPQFLHLSIVRDRKLQESQSPHWGQPVVPRAILEAGGNGVSPRMVLLWVTPVHPTLTVNPDCPSSLLSPLYPSVPVTEASP